MRIIILTIFSIINLLTISYANEIRETPLPNQGNVAPVVAIAPEASSNVSRETKAIRVASLDIFDSKTLSKVQEADIREREYEMIKAMQIEKDIQRAKENIQISTWEDIEVDYQKKLIGQKYRELLKDAPEIDDELIYVVDHIINEIDVEISALQQQLAMLDSQIQELGEDCEENLNMPGCREVKKS